MKLKNLVILLLIVWMGFHSSFTLSLELEKSSYTFGIVPQQSSSKLASLWMPLIKELSDKAGITLVFNTAPDIPTFESRMASGQYDFAYMNPYHYTIFHTKSGYNAIAKERNRKLTGIIVIHKDSPIQSISELNGKVVAFPAPAAFAATLLPLASFQSLGLLVSPSYVNSHDSVYRTVAEKIFIAGGGIDRTFDSIDPTTKNQLRVLWKTKSYTPHAIAYHSKVKEEIASKVQKALVELDQSEAGTALMKSLEFNGFEMAQDSDWDDIRSLHIELVTPD